MPRSFWLLALAVTIVVAAAARAPADEPRSGVQLAHIKLSGDLGGEAPLPSEPLFGTGAENFKSKLDRIKKAKDDAAVQGVYLQIDGLSVGWGKLDELRRAV